MTYSLIIPGIIDTAADFGAVVERTYTDTPPTPVTRFVQIEGRADGPLDLTDASTGGPQYGNRVLSIPLVVFCDGPADRAAKVNEITSRIHGVRSGFRLSWVDGTYTGRFSVDSVSNIGATAARMMLTATCEPFRHTAHAANEVDGWGGAWHVLECGDCPQHPTITCKRQTYVESSDGYGVTLEPGTWRIPYIALTKGENLLYVRTTKPKTRTWADLASSTWASKSGDSWDYVHVDGVSHTPDPLDAVVIEYEIKEI